MKCGYFRPSQYHGHLTLTDFLLASICLVGSVATLYSQVLFSLYWDDDGRMTSGGLMVRCRCGVVAICCLRWELYALSSVISTDHWQLLVTNYSNLDTSPDHLNLVSHNGIDWVPDYVKQSSFVEFCVNKTYILILYDGKYDRKYRVGMKFKVILWDKWQCFTEFVAHEIIWWWQQIIAIFCAKAFNNTKISAGWS